MPDHTADDAVLVRTAAPSLDAQLASSSDGVVGITFSEAAARSAKSLVYSRDTLISPRERSDVIRALQQPAAHRQAAQLDLIVELMSRTKVAELMKTDILRAVAKTVQLVACGRGDAMVVEGEVGNHMYLLVSGAAVVEKADRRGHMRVVKAIEVGHGFGELALQEAGGTRAATVRAAEFSELLLLNGFVYRKVLAKHHREDMNHRVKLLFRLPVFRGIAPGLLHEIAAIMERRTYRMGSFIFRQGEVANSMFVLVSGTVRIVRQMQVSEHVARMQQMDPLMLRLLEPRRPEADRFAPYPERGLANGRPRSVILSGQRRSGKSMFESGAVSERSSGGVNVQRKGASRPSTAPRHQQRNSKAGAAQDDAMYTDATHGTAGHDAGVVERASATVPGLELSGLSAEELDDAGILYAEERGLMHGGGATARSASDAGADAEQPGAGGRASRAGSAAPSHHSTVDDDVEQPANQRNVRMASSTGGEHSGRLHAAATAPSSQKMQKMWVELTTMRAPDYFGEAAMLGRTCRGAAAVADSTVEVLVLLKLDFDLKIDPETRDMLNVLVAQYPKDATFVRDMARKVQWEHYKKKAVAHVLTSAHKEHHLQEYSDTLFTKPWNP